MEYVYGRGLRRRRLDSMNTAKEHIHKFINDFADGGAVNHLADLGMTVEQIVSKLDFPIPKAAVAEMVWKHFLDSGKILMEKPKPGQEFIEKITYEKVQGKYGRSSMQQIRTRIPISAKEYVECDFGKHIKRDYEGFLSRISVLEAEDREYILGLPWPRVVVYHEMDERMRRIMSRLA